MKLQTSHLIFFVCIIIYLIIRGIYMYRDASNIKSVDKSNTRERLLMFLFGASQIGLPFTFLFTSWLNWANYTLPEAIIWLGAPTIVCGLYLFWRSHRDLGDSWSVTLKLNHNHKLVKNGVYHLVRHPMYSSFFLLSFGQAFLLNNWLAGWAALASFTLLYVLRLPHEEAMMLELFGEEYRAYMDHTGRIIPRVVTKKGVNLVV